jgi:hypothetical protein
VIALQDRNANVRLALRLRWPRSAHASSGQTVTVAAALSPLPPLSASSQAHLTGLALGPLFIIPLFVLALRQSLQS